MEDRLQCESTSYGYYAWPVRKLRPAPNRCGIVNGKDSVYQPPIRKGFRLNLDRQESSSSPPVSVAEAERLRQSDYSDASPNRYPTKQLESDLIAVLARRHDLPPECILVGNGIMTILSIVFSAFTERENDLVLPIPSFWPAYTFAIQRGLGIRMPTLSLKESKSTGRFELDPFRLTKALKEPRKSAPALCYLCCPDNPTGADYSSTAIEEVVTSFPSSIFFLDCAYIAFRELHHSADQCIRADDISNVGNILEDLTNSIRSADYLIADLTSQNANVFYELGELATDLATLKYGAHSSSTAV